MPIRRPGRALRRLPAPVLPLLALVLLAAAPRPVAAAGEASILAGVSRIASPGVPGPLCVYGPQATALVAGDGGNGTRLPVMATAHLDRGRVVAFGHDGYFNREVLETADTGRLLANALRWAAHDQASPRVGVVGLPGTAGYLTDAGFQAQPIDLVAIAGQDVVVLVPWSQSPAEVQALLAYVRAGGGLIVAATGWGWAQLNPDRDLQLDYAGNRLLAAAGIQWADDYLGETAAGGGYEVSGLPSVLTTADPALAAAQAHDAGGRRLGPGELAQVSRTLVMNAACVPPDDTLFLPRLKAVTGAIVVPSPADPVSADEVIDRLSVVLQTRELNELPLSEHRAHPAAELFPGAVPAAAARTQRSVTLDTRVPDWHSTGVYAPPGGIVEVRLPVEAADLGLGLRIGAHTDTLWGVSEPWTRMPDISRAWPLTRAITQVFSPFGGNVYVTVPWGARATTVELTIAGVVEAPSFTAGVTTPGEWTRLRREALAPWAEVGSGRMVVTVPSAEVRELIDPAPVAEAWARVVELDAELAAWEAPLPRPERFVTDQQISAGYMHSGYPLMCHLDQAAHLVDARHLTTEGNWGFFHEVGHNHQSGDWTFAGTGEVTVNLFTLYSYEHLVGIPPLANERGSVAFVREQLAKVADWRQPDFAQWQSDPFLALAMYLQLQHAFGWEAFRRVFAEYRALPDSDRPRTDDEKRDQWLVRFSRTVGRDLGPFFEAWGLPTSAAARAAVADLPGWLPRDFPPSYALDPTPTPTVTATATVQPGRVEIYLPWVWR